ncbi:MAG: hypothetical protein EXS31_17955 [Pedosphaera sp.]|nr:hypothetical protein [Pedosphaera sp.]
MNPNREEPLLAQALTHSQHHQFQSTDVLEVPPVKGGELAASVVGCRGNNKVLVTGHFARCLKLRPDAGVLAGDLVRVGNDREEREDCFQISLSSRPVFGTGVLNAMPQFGDDDRGEFDFLGRVEREPVAQIECALLAPDDDIRIEDYRHLSSGALKAARACRRSSAQTRASSGERSVVASARASSAPVQLGTGVGTKRATGTEASSTTNVVCSRARATHSARLRPVLSKGMAVSFTAQRYLTHSHLAKPDNFNP